MQLLTTLLAGAATAKALTPANLVKVHPGIGARRMCVPQLCCTQHRRGWEQGAHRLRWQQLSSRLRQSWWLPLRLGCCPAAVDLQRGSSSCAALQQAPSLYSQSAFCWPYFNSTAFRFQTYSILMWLCGHQRRLVMRRTECSAEYQATSDIFWRSTCEWACGGCTRRLGKFSAASRGAGQSSLALSGRRGPAHKCCLSITTYFHLDGLM